LELLWFAFSRLYGSQTVEITHRKLARVTASGGRYTLGPVLMLVWNFSREEGFEKLLSKVDEE